MARYDKNGFIVELGKNEIFVFGSNSNGYHGGGAAKTALDKFGAIWGQAEGLQGQSYAINTMSGLNEMEAQIKRFYQFAYEHRELTFYVTEIGCGIAGYGIEQVAPFFSYWPTNVVIPESFREYNKMLDRARGMLIGLAVGDALGAPVEFGYSSEDIVGLGDKIGRFQDSFAGPAGTWTDDTSMALCLADSLLACGGYDSYDIMERYCRWMNEGYRTRDGKPAIDVGNQTRKALVAYRRDRIIHRGSPRTDSAGNGAIMRLAPIVLAASRDNNLAGSDNIRLSALSCRETHDSFMAMACTGVFAVALDYELHYGQSDWHMMRGTVLWPTVRAPYDQSEYAGKIEELIARSNDKDGDGLKNLGGYIADALTIALWGLKNFESFEDGMLAVIRLGGDTDTNAAIYGQLAGAHYGYHAIPEKWRENVYLSHELVQIADDLLKMKGCPIIKTRFEDDKDFNKLEADNADMSKIKSVGELLSDYSKMKRSDLGEALKKNHMSLGDYQLRRIRREKLRDIFRDTCQLINDNDRLSSETDIAKQMATFYDYADYENYESERHKTAISITGERSFEAAKRLLGEDSGKIAILNFANCSTPGGGVLGGSGAQEESLCRCSNLYQTIAQERFRHLYYDPNRARWDPRANDAIIYSPGVMVFKSDTDYPTLLPEDEWYKVDVITCAAPTLRHGLIISDDRTGKSIKLTPEVQYEIHLKRAKHILNIALSNGARRLVLGAFGCGAFKNDPRSVASAYRDALKEYDGQFKEIVFAIYHQPHEVDNYNTFKEVFGENELL